MVDEVKQLDDIYRQLVNLYSSTTEDNFFKYNVRKIIENFEQYLYQLHGESWAPSDLF